MTDQAELHGLLAKVRDLGVTLLWVMILNHRSPARGARLSLVGNADRWLNGFVMGHGGPLTSWSAASGVACDDVDAVSTGEGQVMEPIEGAATFEKSGADYDAFMGRYSRLLAAAFADWAGVKGGNFALDVGCGPGALTGVLAERLGSAAVLACDPSVLFVAECRARHPGVEVSQGHAEDLPYQDHSQDLVLAQLVLHFVSDPSEAVREMRRVLRPGGTVAACSWDFDQGMDMLRYFWDAALSVDPAALDEVALRFGKAGEIAQLFSDAGFEAITESTLEVASFYSSYDELWSGFLAGIGPAGSYAVRQPHDRQQALRQALFQAMGSPTGPFELRAVARAGRGVAPRN